MRRHEIKIIITMKDSHAFVDIWALKVFAACWTWREHWIVIDVKCVKSIAKIKSILLFLRVHELMGGNRIHSKQVKLKEIRVQKGRLPGFGRRFECARAHGSVVPKCGPTCAFWWENNQYRQGRGGRRGDLPQVSDFHGGPKYKLKTKKKGFMEFWKIRAPIDL